MVALCAALHGWSRDRPEEAQLPEQITSHPEITTELSARRQFDHVYMKNGMWSKFRSSMYPDPEGNIRSYIELILIGCMCFGEWQVDVA